MLARYDEFKLDKTATSAVTDGAKRKTTIAGVAYKYNKNVKFIVNIINNKNTAFDGSITKDYKKAMLTAEVKW